MLDTPRVIAGPQKYIKAKLNDTISLQCQFRTPFEVTIVVWLKDNLPVKNTQNYNIITTTDPGVEGRVQTKIVLSTMPSCSYDFN